jgi:signal transduction histidine kinase
VALHFSGGIESPAFFDPVAVLVVAALVLSTADSLVQGLLACALQDGVVILEATRALHHVPLGILSDHNVHSARYVSGLLVVYDSLVLFVVGLVVFIAHRLRDREADLVRVYGQERQTVARLEELDRLKSDFLASVSHELRTPLTAIEGFALHLGRNWQRIADEQRLDEVHTIGRQAKRLHALVTNLLEFSAIEAGKVSVQVEVVDLGPLIRSAAALSACPDAVVVVPDGLRASCDPARTEQVLVNLLDNAAKYGAPPVTVAAQLGAHEVVVGVSDAGPGVPADRRSELFSRFAQLHRGVRQTSTGVGMGLALVKGYVEAQGGRVWYEAPDGGSARFCFTLGLVSEAPASDGRGQHDEPKPSQLSPEAQG